MPRSRPITPIAISEDLFTPATLVGGHVQFNTETVSTNIENQIRTDLRTGGVALTMNVEVTPRFTVTSISSYRAFDFFTIYDIDATTATSIQPIFTNGIDTFTQEVRGVYTGPRFRFTVGANYYKEEGDVRLRVNPIAYTEAQLRLDSAALCAEPSRGDRRLRPVRVRPHRYADR